jgi:hypothetical protein
VGKGIIGRTLSAASDFWIDNDQNRKVKEMKGKN